MPKITPHDHTSFSRGGILTTTTAVAAPSSVAHSETTGRTADDHHAQAHALSGADHSGAISDAQHGTRAVANPHRISAGAAGEELGAIKLAADAAWRAVLALDPSGYGQLLLGDGAGEYFKLYSTAANVAVVNVGDVLDLGPAQLYLPDGASVDANPGAVRVSDATAGDEALEIYAGGAARSVDLRGHLVEMFFQLPAGSFVGTGTVQMPLVGAAVAGLQRLPRPWGGSIVGLSFRVDTNCTAGTLDIEAMNDGVASGFKAQITVGLNRKTAVQVAGTDTFVADKTIGAQLITSGYTPTATNVYGSVLVLLERV